jgi:hypothetical protein
MFHGEESVHGKISMAEWSWSLPFVGSNSDKDFGFFHVKK